MIKTVKANDNRSRKLTPASAAYQAASKVLHRTLPGIPSDGRYNLTISRQHRFVWFRVAKVCTRTIFNVFENNAVRLDAEHPMFCHYPASDYADYFKFAFVRNPWDRFASAWRDKIVQKNHFHLDDATLARLQDFDAFVDYVSDWDMADCDQHLRLQCRLIDLNHADFVGRFETFDADFNLVLDRIGLAAAPVDARNVTRKPGSYETYYNQRTRRAVEKLYARDISIFGYNFAQS